MNFAHTIASYCVKALVYEVIATPKPGLVDSNDSGAHTDMNLFTFFESAFALYPYFLQCAEYGVQHTGTPSELFVKARSLGVEAEKIMLRATGGVNTHKGIIFSFGLVCLAAGYVEKNNPEKRNDPHGISEYITKMVHNISEEMRYKMPGKTYGQSAFLQLGIKGIRGEAEEGFSKALHIGLRAFESFYTGENINDALLYTMLHIMKSLDDTNVIGRGGYEHLRWLQAEAKNILNDENSFRKNNYEMLKRLNASCIKKNISPGGVADYLALTLLFYFLKQRV
ncbi:triphosphoribosyl-dephospho-CoA synthase CitG [Treponema phagedenis]|uniref:Probable 2-(5''-triphosphoribosyl)-3'-dephosphocoenzyme-A synthase n=1 Tax=Treponema phagedenis TaxID=162 RepID=A0A0B7GPH4_TREPH|nr:triphosphoribosyl-dephospho-CoA synthase CitG [Treponema phagedenis]EFW37674.1 triphosphoribosyl-dephospho-CoA synthase [Treponema phagedenis F0421]NVP24448.1 triphosphoribosyl-dephospho-CoA synthase CitG [Treponema phagedenis]QEJ95467.1 triphosphoribosyl-dephospho-CoA synthase CitG [Treponema phagedenis]QEJ97792.1 triphosphoribosyl-dephospho-CoA synthase CitG [Treponema phagedenis]QEK01321.1 triphosphoribosyl-dephospho-CoA synthase CitG [Treponema phagedenis]